MFDMQWTSHISEIMAPNWEMEAMGVLLGIRPHSGIGDQPAKEVIG